MSQEFMDPELIADFITEAKEHLETIEPNLLELEKAPDNLALLNEIFRPMHSLKGASGFLGLNRINLLAHRAENILDELRKGAMVVTSEIMDVILSATDALRQMIDNLEQGGGEGDVEIEAIIAQIDAIMSGDIPAPAPVDAQPTAEPESSPEDPEETSEEVAPQASEPQTDPVEDTASGPSAPMPEQSEPSEAGKNAQPTGRSAISAREWIASLAKREAYALTAFGEGHLKDFIDEAREITENLSTGLLDLERSPAGDSGLVNDLFRYFHNLKGNSGIIGFHELNSLTHEAETLLNRVRHGEMPVSRELVDLLLLVVDVMDALTDQIDPAAGNAQPFDIAAVLTQLQQAVAGGAIELPEALRGASVGQNGAELEEATAPAGAAIPPLVIHPVGVDRDEDDVDVFRSTVQQQQEIIRVALAELQKDSSQKDYVDALFRSFTAIQKASGFMGLKDLSVYAERTASLVNQGRSSGLDFSLMTELLGQESAIINDMVQNELDKLSGGVVVQDDGPGVSALQPASAEPPRQESESQTPPAATSVESEPVSAAPEAGVVPPAASPVVPKPESKVESVSTAESTSVPTPVESKTESKGAPKPAPVSKPASPKPAPASAPAAPPKAEPDKGAPKPAAPAGGGEHKASSTIRVDHEKLDHLMNLIGELIINRNRYTMLARRLEGCNGDAEIADIAQNLSETTYAMARVSDDLQDTIMKVRMVPVSSVFSRFPRLVRDLSRKSGKEVELILEGEETELDKSVVEVIGDPLVHLIRNSVDHGVEPEAERLAKGKPVKGKVVLRAYHKGNSVAIEIEDDGQGLDPDKLREVAVRKGLMSAEEARQLDDREAKELIFAPGFSSAEKITDISGRGVGMDVVRTNIKALKGSINIASEVGKGTKFTLSLPLTLAIIDALMINVAGETFAIPLDAVSETTKIEASRLTDVKGRKAVTLRGEVLGIMELGELLNLERKPLPEVLSVVVIHDNDRRLGLVVDRLLERQEIVIKPLGSYLGDVRGISGATITGDGGVILILDPHEVYLMATSNKAMSS